MKAARASRLASGDSGSCAKYLSSGVSAEPLSTALAIASRKFISLSNKFFPTPDSVKEALILKYVQDCSKYFNERSSNISTENLSVVILRCVEILYDYFQESRSSQIIILNNTITPPINSSAMRLLAENIETFTESNIKLPEMHNKDGVYRVLTQIIISIFSLNVKEGGLLNETGKIEAHRAGYSYMLNWVNQSS